MEMKELLKQKKVQYGIVGGMAVILLAGVAIYESTKIKIDYTLNDNVIEYGIAQNTIDWMKQSTKNGNKITVAEFDTKKIGETEVVFTVCLDDTCKDFTQKLEIKDTKNPEITLKSETVKITEGDDFDPVSNIESVKDPIDGDIQISDDEKITKNGYLINSDVDNKKAGEYAVKITAYDVNGNKTEKEYAVTVKEKPKEAEPNQMQQTPQTTYTPPTTTQNQENTKPSTNSTPSNNQQTQTCVANGQWRSVGNSGVAFYTEAEADAWIEANCDWKNYSASVITVHDICGVKGYSIRFTPLDK